jgi:hypothetical protein
LPRSGPEGNMNADGATTMTVAVAVITAEMLGNAGER